jgi:hypothetical protein
LSSAILYLAIVAIWAVVLVPRWLRPRPAPPQPVPVPAEPSGAAPSSAAASTGLASPGPDAAPAWTASAELPAGEPPADEPAADASGAGPAADASGAGPAADASGAEAGDGTAEEVAAPSPVERRAEIVKARRRLLTTLLTLTIIAVALAVTRIDAYWIVIPPAVLLAGYLALLREFAHIDAERARRAGRVRRAAALLGDLQEPASQDRLPAARTGAEPDLDAAPAVPAALGGAEIIDISARISDQVYDQYSDAANRAVGD